MATIHFKTNQREQNVQLENVQTNKNQKNMDGQHVPVANNLAGQEKAMKLNVEGTNTAFVLNQKLQIAEPQPLSVQGQTTPTLVATTRLNLRTGPGTNNSRITTLPAGTPLTVLNAPEGSDWIEVEAVVNGQTYRGWVHKDYTAPIGTQVNGGGNNSGTGTIVRGGRQFINPVNGQPHNFIGGNYTDLGMIDTNGDGITDTFSAEQARADLARLQQQGVTNVRIWATDIANSNGAMNDPAAAAARVRAIAEIAGELEMSITVDLADLQGMDFAEVQNDPAQLAALNQRLDALISTIVGSCSDLRNIQWSIGNEPKYAIIEEGEGDQAQAAVDFANWYAQKANLIRRTGGSGTRVIAELVPGSVNHPGVRPDVPEFARAAQIIINASDIVSVHFYPEHAANDPATANDLSWSSVQWWANQVNRSGKAFVIGEFGLPPGIRNDQVLQGWLETLYNLPGVDHVSFWQFMKDEGYGHWDDLSWVQFPNNNVSFVDFLRNNGWLNRPPLNNGR